jgi:hypothetical protein
MKLWCGVLLLLSSTVFAHTVKLYQKPQLSAQVISTISSGSQLIPIFYPKQGTWLKVADPKNGNVGWVRFSDLKGESTLPGLQKLSFKQRLESRHKHGQAPEIVRILEYSGPSKLSEAQASRLVEQMQQRQAQLNASMQLMLRAMTQDLNHYQQLQPFGFNDDFFTFPRLQPMLIVPHLVEPTSADTTPMQTKKSNNSWWQRLKNKLRST